jgi:hypothetical protein
LRASIGTAPRAAVNCSATRSGSIAAPCTNVATHAPCTAQAAKTRRSTSTPARADGSSSPMVIAAAGRRTRAGSGRVFMGGRYAIRACCACVGEPLA